MDNPELTQSAASIDATLRDIAATAVSIADGLQLLDDELVTLREKAVENADSLTGIYDELSLMRRAAFPPRKLRAAGSWPWAPGTVAQGFLGARWNRRDGNVYGTTGLRAVSGPNSPIRGGDDAKAKISVPSGARRS